MYLVAIMQACEFCVDTPIPIPDIAETLNVQPVSVNQMVKKLSDEGLVKYLPYKGVQLTLLGADIAAKVIRHRRLWEVFLVKHLHLDLEEADNIACKIEHYTSDDLGHRLDEYLDHPTVCYHGKAIPRFGEDQQPLDKGVPLNLLKVGQSSPVMEINSDQMTSNYLFDEGIRPGVTIRIMAISKHGDFLLDSDYGRTHISKELANQIIVGSPETESD